MELQNTDNDFLYMRNAESEKNGLKKLIDYVNSFANTKELNMIEIGSYLGESTIIFAEHFNSVISIDPFIDKDDVDDVNFNYANFGKVYEAFKKNIENVSNILHLKETSDDAINKLPQEKYFMVYIDGVHTYEQVKKDINNYKNIISEGGFVCGHDYSIHWKGVKKAVNEAFGSPDIVFEDNSWAKRL